MEALLPHWSQAKSAMVNNNLRRSANIAVVAAIFLRWLPPTVYYRCQQNPFLAVQLQEPDRMLTLVDPPGLKTFSVLKLNLATQSFPGVGYARLLGVWVNILSRSKLKLFKALQKVKKNTIESLKWPSQRVSIWSKTWLLTCGVIIRKDFIRAMAICRQWTLKTLK